MVLEYGWNSTAYQILNPGFTLWLSRSRPAVVGYVQAPRRRVVGGAPVCAAADLSDVAAEFEHDARRAGSGVVYFGAEGRLGALYDGEPGHPSVLLGAQPAWDPHHWDSIVRSRASLRAHSRRFYNFDGLDTFKAKFAPALWEPVYAIAAEPRFSPVSLWGIAWAFTAGHPVRTVAAGTLHAAAQELKWAARLAGRSRRESFSRASGR